MDYHKLPARARKCCLYSELIAVIEPPVTAQLRSSFPSWASLVEPYLWTFVSAPNNEHSGKYVIIHVIAVDAAYADGQGYPWAFGEQGCCPREAALSGVRMTFFWDKAWGSLSSDPCLQSFDELWFGVEFTLS